MTSKIKHWPIFVLTLVGDEERRSGLIDQLEKLDLPFHLHFGIDGRQGLPKEFEKLIDREGAHKKNGRDLSDGEFACALSHRTIYQEVVKRNAPGAIVLEDDAVVDRKLRDFIEMKGYEAANLVMLDHSHARVRGPRIQLGDVSEARTLSLPSCLTTAYSISLEGCASLIAATSPLVDLADWPGDICRLGALALAPQIVAHPDPSSGVSHLREGRTGLSCVRSSPFRFFQYGFWSRWVTKRLSTRIS